MSGQGRGAPPLASCSGTRGHGREARSHFSLPGWSAMNTAELYKAGRLAEAIDAQVQEVKASPLDQAKRLFLFELAMFAGDLDRARRQIDALEYTDNDLIRAAMGYRKLINSEQARRRVL